MKLRHVLTAILLFQLVLLGGSAAGSLTASTLSNPPPTPATTGPEAISAARPYPSDNNIPLAIRTSREQAPAVAFCSTYGYYLVVYERSVDIYGQYVDQNASSLSLPFRISNGVGRSFSPDVACLPSANMFLVTWTYDFIPDLNATDYDIHARLVQGRPQRTNVLLGTELSVADNTYHERDPAVACNAGALSCLIVYETGQTGNYGVSGHRVKVTYGPIDVEKEGDSLVLARGVHTRTPDPDPVIAWGPQDGTYLVAWEHYFFEFSLPFIGVTHVYDTYQGSGDQFPHETYYLLADDSLPSLAPIGRPAVAASAKAPTEQRFLVAFEYNGDIWGVYWHGREGSIAGPFPITASSANEAAPRLAYSGGVRGERADTYLNQYLVTFLRFQGNGLQLMLQGVRGMWKGEHLQRVGPTNVLDSSATVRLPSFLQGGIAGSINTGRYLAVWEREISRDHAEDNKDIYGNLVFPACYSLQTRIEPSCPGCSIVMSPSKTCNQGKLYPHAEQVSLTAHGAGEYTFSHWSGDATGSEASTTLSMMSNRIVTAHFRTKARVLFDEAHDERNTLSWARAQIIEPDHPAWVYFGKLRDGLADEFTFVQNKSAPLTTALLRDYDVLMLSAPRTDLSLDEHRAIQRFVARGGGLVLLGDCGISLYTKQFYGIEFYPFCLFAPVPSYVGDFVVDDFEAHPAVADISTYRVNWGQPLSAYAPAQVIAFTNGDVWLDLNENGQYNPGQDPQGRFHMMAVNDQGCGRIIALSDNAFQDSGYQGRGNEPVMRSMLRWAAQGTACKEERSFIPLVSNVSR